jgi:hypothetical protein
VSMFPASISAVMSELTALSIGLASRSMCVAQGAWGAGAVSITLSNR